MACGTPVIAWRRGSVPEVVEHGVTGFIVEGIDDAVAAVDKVRSLSRGAVRRRFEARFSIERAARDYVRVYQSLCAEPIVLPSRERRSGVDHAAGRSLMRAPTRRAAVLSRRGARSGNDIAVTGSGLGDHATREASKGAPSPTPYYIRATYSILERRPRTLKHGDTFAVFDSFGDMASRRGGLTGSSINDTRYFRVLGVAHQGHAAAPTRLWVFGDDNLHADGGPHQSRYLYSTIISTLPRETIYIVRTDLYSGTGRCI